MQRLFSLYLLTFVLLVGFLSGCAAETKAPESVKIGVLMMGDSRSAKLDGLKKGLHDLGWSDTRAEYIIQNAKDDETKLLENANSLLKQQPDVIAVTGVVEAEALLKQEVSKISVPVIMMGVISHPDLDLKKSYETAGISILGVDNGHVELTAKRMELLTVMFPERNHLVLLYDPRLRPSLLALQEAREAAGQSTLKIEEFPVRGPEDLEALRRKNFTGKESILVLPSYYLESSSRTIRDISFANRVPVMGLDESEMLIGYTASYGVSYYDLGYQSARLLVKGLSGESPGSSFELPDVVRLKVNMQAANRLKVSISPAGLSFAEKIWEMKE